MSGEAKSEELSELLRRAVKHGLSNIHTALPAQIESYDHTEQRASVKPLIKKSYRDGKVESLPVIERVPVIFPRGTDFSMTWPLQQGDTVLLVFSERSMEKWLAKGGEQEPGDTRQFSLTDAIAIPGLQPFQRQGGWGGIGDLLGVVEDGGQDLGAASLRDTLAGVVPQINSAVNILTTVANQLGEENPDLAGIFTSLNGAIDVLGTAGNNLAPVFPELRGRTNSVAGILPLFNGMLGGLRAQANTIALANEDLDGIATAIGMQQDLPRIAESIAATVDGLNTVQNILGKAYTGLGGVGELIGFVSSSMSTTSHDVEMQYKGFRFVINSDGRYAMGNDFDEFMIIMQTLMGALCASVCIPGAPLTEIPVFIALFQRLISLRGNLNSLIPFVGQTLPDFIGRLGPEPLDIIDFEEELD